MPAIVSIHGRGLKAPKEQEPQTGWPLSIAAVLFAGRVRYRGCWVPGT
jgi:hypothetical protein